MTSVPDVQVRPIELGELDRVNLRCYPERDALGALFALQGTIGFAAWEGDACVGLLHTYRLVLPGVDNSHWPAWNRGWWVKDVLARALDVKGPVLCHACFHVGRTLESAASDEPDPRYFGHGIGTALCRASVEWARERDYTAVLGTGVPDGFIQLARWCGALPWTTYGKQDFETVAFEAPEGELPAWARGECPPEVQQEVMAMCDARRPAGDFRTRLMVRRLKG